jgi:hypothetical protein
MSEGYLNEIDEIPVTMIALSMIRYIEDGNEANMTPRYNDIFQRVLDDGGYLVTSIMAATSAVARDLLHTMTPEQQQEWWLRVLPDGPI